MSEERDVLIVGGSLVGLTTAVLLRLHGVDCLVVERHAGTAIHPRAGHFHLRTVEILRSVGQASNAVGAHDARQRRRPGVVLAGRLEEVEVVKPSGGHVDDDALPLPGPLVELDAPRRPSMIV